MGAAERPDVVGSRARGRRERGRAADRPDRELRRHRMEQLLEEFGITHIAGVKGYSLSGGERRRVEIARALITKPAFMLLDEPFAGIDPIAVADIQNLIVSLKERNIGVLISDHNVRETLGDRQKEFAAACKQVERIALLRLNAMLPD